MDATSSRPLYWPLQEFIYANGELKTPIRWAAQRVRGEHPEFAGGIRPLNFTGEAMFPWMFEQERALRPFKPAMDVLMEDTHFGTIYDATSWPAMRFRCRPPSILTTCTSILDCSSTRCLASVVHIIGLPTSLNMTACMVPPCSDICLPRR